MDDKHDLHEVVVLAVDDTEDNLDLLEEYLGDEVWTVLRASSGEEAVRLATEHQPDIVLLDLNMPGMNGLSVIRALKSTSTLDGVGIILQTAFADRDNVLTAVRLGCQHVLGKPLEKERLLAEIRTCLDELPPRAARRPADATAKPTRPKSIAVSLDDALEAIEAGELTEVMNDPHTIDCLHELIASDSPVGKRLIKVANSPAYAGATRTESVAQAIVRIGTKKTHALIRQSADAGNSGLSSNRASAVIKLLEIITRVFPDRTATVDDTRALLRELAEAAPTREKTAKPQAPPEDSETPPASGPAADAAGAVAAQGETN